jgi:hypothetical protein
MEPADREMVAQTLDALERLMRMFQAERIVYLVSALASFVLLLYAAFLMFNSGGVSAAEIGLIFGATGVSAISGSRIAYFLNKAFNLIEDILRKLSGVAPRNDG